ncbi:interferon alpha-inducible protein 27-like protein 2B isoform X2 [Lampetra planeri]
MTSQWMATLVMATILGISLGPVVAKKETSTYWWNFCAEKKSTNWWNFCAEKKSTSWWNFCAEEKSTNWWIFSVGEEELTILCYVGVLALGGVVVVDLTPLAIRAMGFTAEGIVAGSMAAWLMAREAAANGGGVVDGGVVATLQSIGVAGLSIPAKIIVWTAGVAITKVVVDICCCVLKHL